MELRLELKLLQVQDVRPFDEKYAKRPVFTTTVSGIEMEYALGYEVDMYEVQRGPRGRETDRHLVGEARLGYQEPESFDDEEPDTDRIIIPRNVKAAQIPFVALYFHLKTMGDKQLEEVTGTNPRDFPISQREELVLGTVLNYAADYLKPGDMADLIDRFRGASTYDPHQENIFSKVCEAYARGDASTTDLVALSSGRDDFYIDEITNYVTNHHHNKWTRRSRGFRTVINRIGSTRAKSMLAAYVTKADFISPIIDQDPKYKANLLGITEAIGTIVDRAEQNELKTGTRFIIDNVLAGFLYDGEQALVGSGRVAPYKFIEDGEGASMIEMKGYAKTFFSSLHARLVKKVVDQRQEAVAALEDLSNVVTRVGSEGDLALQFSAVGSLLTEHQEEITPNAMVVASPDETSVRTTLEGHIQQTGSVIATTAQESRDFAMVGTAVNALAALGVAVPVELDDIARQYVEAGHRRIVAEVVPERSALR